MSIEPVIVTGWTAPAAEKDNPIQYRFDHRLDVAHQLDRVAVLRGTLLAVSINDGKRKCRTKTPDGYTIDAYEARELPFSEEAPAGLIRFYRIGVVVRAEVHDLLSVTILDDGSGEPANAVVYEGGAP